MSSSNHLSKEMHDLVKSIGETRSKQEEDRIIINEQQKLKDQISAKGQSQKKQRENIIKAIYIDMLGHDSSFAHIHAVNMTQSKSLKMKRLGYLCCCLFLQNNSELLLLLVAALQKDLKGSIHEIVVALTALAKLINPTIAAGVQEEVYKLLNHQTDLIRKKAIMVMQKLYTINPQSIPDYEDKMRRALCDKEPSVMGTTLNLYYVIIKQNPLRFKDLVSSFTIILKQIIDHKLSKDFDYHRMPAPWIQIKLLQILSLLGENDQVASEQIYEVLQMALKRADDTGINIGHAVTFQCVKTISTIYPNQNLLEIASSSVSKFLTSENNNLKYLGINALIEIVHVNPKYVIEHQVTIVDCLESKDDTLRHETLDLLFKMTNSANIVIIIDKLLFFLKADHEPYFKRDLVNKITSLSERFCPNQQWFINTMNMVFEHGSEFISNNILNNFLKLINENFNTEGDSFGKFIIDTYMKIVTKPNLADITIKMISWVLGEIGSIIYDNDEEQINKLTEVLLTVITNDFEDQKTRCWILSALAKLSSCNSFVMSDQLAVCLNYYSKSKDIETAERSKDFINLYKYTAALRQSQQIVFDENLSFLDKYVNESIKNGAKPYDKSKSLKVAIGNQSQAEPEIYYKKKDQDVFVNLKPVGNEDVQVKFTGEKKWSLERGYQENKQESKPKPVIEAQSSQNVKKTQSISSEDFKQKAQSSNGGVFRQTIEQTNARKTEAQLKQEQKKKELEQQQKSEKMDFINNLFQGVTNLNVQYSTQPQNIKWQTESMSAHSQQQKSSNTDLLGISDQQASLPKSKPLETEMRFQPLSINIEEYEKHWESLKLEEQKSFQTKIRTEADYKNFLKELNIYVVDVINNEVVSSGKNVQTGNILLLYGTYDQSGKLGVTIKTNSREDISYILSRITGKYC